MHYYDYDEKPHPTYPGRNIVLGIQVLLVVGIIFFGILALEETSPMSTSHSTYYYSTQMQPSYSVSDLEAFYSQGINYKIAGQYDEALDMYNRAIEIAPTFSWSYLNRGVVYEVMGDEANADTDFWRFMRMHVDEMRTFSTYELGERISVTMRDGRLISFPFSASAGDMLTFRAEAQDSDYTDPLIVVIDDNGDVIAAQDDTFTNSNQWVSMDASIPYLVIPEDCSNCQLIVGHAGGGAEGIIDVVITPHHIMTGDACSDPFGY